MMKYDKNGDGFDFEELYRASGGQPEDLWLILQYFYLAIFHPES